MTPLTHKLLDKNQWIIFVWKIGCLALFLPRYACIYLYFLSLSIKDEMKDQGIPRLEAVFISVDPDRDTPEVMKNYLKGKLHNTAGQYTH